MLSGFRWKRNDNKCYCLSFKYQKPKNLFCFSYKYFQRFLLLNSFFVLNRKTDFFSFLWRNKNVFLLVILKLINYVQSTWDKQYFLFFNPCPSLQPSQLYYCIWIKINKAMHWVSQIFNESVFLTIYLYTKDTKIQTLNRTKLIQTKYYESNQFHQIGEFFKGTSV